MKKIIILSFLFVSTFVLYSCNGQGQTPSDEGNNIKTDTAVNTGKVTVENKKKVNYNIEITSAGFSPNTITINAGEIITFINGEKVPHWPATAKHPLHTVYPGSGIEKCGTAEQPTIFDACKGLGLNETFSFVFNEKGEWKYHDHLNPKLFGTIIVK